MPTPANLPSYSSTAFTGEESETEPHQQVRNEDLYPANTVFVNIYDITEANTFLATLGIGAHHAGIQVYDKEYHFGRCASGTGVGTNDPCYCTPHLFREQYALGLTACDAAQVRALVRAMEKDPNWQGMAYHLICNNCVHFAEVLAQSLLPPDVRLAQSQRNDTRFYQCWSTEMGQLSSGAVVKLPVLMPPHVNRLTRSVLSYIPHVFVDKLDSFDRDAGLEAV